MGTKSLITTTRFTQAKREHKCKANKKHTIYQHDLRLEVKNERNWDKYCMHCAAIIIKKMEEDSVVLSDQFKVLLSN
ncbi:hypothetical protein CWN98_01525 [Vibrio splendidus]|uniref:hypothetical protein n=1 Tax=Vibrio splendidus TaxID=29497 RepID=UPI000D386FC5|nr:hypothetical protein [Vibrio splendidus]PTO90159.1 hypothetical protein CWN98_01525 [Vibrio splendidus]PTP50448.1 hypothetical protein CWO10_02890 [Vibrio splendidus]